MLISFGVSSAAWFVFNTTFVYFVVFHCWLFLVVLDIVKQDTIKNSILNCCIKMVLVYCILCWQIYKMERVSPEAIEREAFEM